MFAECIIAPVARTSGLPVSHTITGEFISASEAFRFGFVANKDLQVVQSGERTNAAGKPVGNKMPLSISGRDYSSLRPHLEYVSLPNHLVLHEPGGKLEFAYFLRVLRGYPTVRWRAWLEMSPEVRTRPVPNWRLEPELATDSDEVQKTVRELASKRAGYIIAPVKSKMLDDFGEAEAADRILKLYILEGLAAIGAGRRGFCRWSQPLRGDSLYLGRST
jgi:hypothetical protein